MGWAVMACSSSPDEAPPVEQPQQRLFNVVFSAGEGGGISSSGGNYQQGDVISVSATPQENYAFSSWSNGATQNPLQITVNGEINITANFIRVENPNPTVVSSVILQANSEGNTYEHITSVLAPSGNPVEVPDCNHADFGPHIDTLFDDALGKHVFRFYIHVEPDNDRCINFDRQRNEIKTYDKSPEETLGRAGEIVRYLWKFKLSEGFQSSPKFTHIHQLKSVGGEYESMPMYTLTTRKGNPDKLELRYAETTNQITLSETPLSPLIDQWIEATETILYATEGSYLIELKNVATEEILFRYQNKNIINWRPEASFVRPKWGIYRSLVYPEDLRDESLLFADFSIEEMQ